MSLNLIVSPSAEKFMRRMVRFSGRPEGAGFRLTVSAGGCSGYNTEFTVEDAPLAGDTRMDVNGLPLFLPAESRLLLDGATLGFADTPTQSGLTVVHPDAKNCGCSTAESKPAMPGVSAIKVSSIRRNAPAPGVK